MGFRSWLIPALVLLPLAAAAQAPGPPSEVMNQARVARAITPSDSTALALGPTRAVYNGSASTCALAVTLADDTAAVTLANVASGAFLPIRAKLVMATNTTCTGIVGLW